MSQRDDFRQEARDLIRFVTSTKERLRCYELFKDGTNYQTLKQENTGHAPDQLRKFKTRGLIREQFPGSREYELTPIGQEFTEKFDPMLERTMKLLKVRDLQTKLDSNSTDFLSFTPLSEGEFTKQGGKNWLYESKYKNHIENSIKISEYVPRLEVRPESGRRSPFDKAIESGQLEEVNFIHSNTAKNQISNNKKDLKKAAEHEEVKENCEVSYRLDKRDEIKFNKTFSIFEYPDGSIYITILLTDENMLFQVSTEDAKEWAEVKFKECWNNCEPLSYKKMIED